MAKILMLASEATPFASTGGLAEVLQGLPIALHKARQEVAVLLPFYPRIRNFSPRHTYRTLHFTLGPRTFSADVYEYELSGVLYLFLDIPALYNRSGIYGDGADYPDNHLRFGALARAALSVAQSLFNPDIIHCHDWQTALAPVLLRESLGANPALAGIKTVLTIHNLAFQGKFPKGAAADLGLTGQFVPSSAVEPDGSVSFLKGGIAAGDAITTVSPTYAQEIQTPAAGHGLDPLLRSRRAHLRGILNGIDFDVWNPATDPHLPAHFSAADLSGKELCKLALLKQTGLPATSVSQPLIGVVARLTPQKGLDLLMRRPHDLMDCGVSLILLGEGDSQQEEFFRWLASAYSTRVSVQIGYTAQFAHRILAGVDLFLMPSRYEPCGLTQLYAMRYGTLPLVHATGGLKDSVTPETGFQFSSHTAEALLACLRQAVAQWQTRRWREMQLAAMRQDTSWSRPAAAYSALYDELLAEKS